jgi:hypothetical protein
VSIRRREKIFLPFFKLKKGGGGWLRLQSSQMVCFQTKNPKFGQTLEGLRWENVDISWPFGIFYDHFCKFCVHLVHFPGFGIMLSRTIWQPWQHDFGDNEDG